MHKFTQAKELAGSFVYGLYDKDGLFYIGKTTNARKRFSRYLDRMLNAQVKQRLSKGGDDIFIDVLVQDPPDLLRAESDLILVNSGKLLNKVHNRLPLCSLCNKPMQNATRSRHRKAHHKNCDRGK